MKKSYLLRGLECPNCASKIEREALELDGVHSSVMNLIKQTLTLELDGDSDDIRDKLAKIVRSHEPDVEVCELSETPTPHIPPHHSAHSHDSTGNAGIISRLIIGAVLFTVGVAMPHLTDAPGWLCIVLLGAAYIILGSDVLGNAVRGIIRGHVFDENFLMSAASIGAILIGETHEAAAVMLFYQLGEFFQHLAVDRSRRSISALLDIRPDKATVIRGGIPTDVHPSEITLGETVIIKPGERVPLDGTVTDGCSTLDTAALTGESVPRSVRAGHEVLSGCINQSGVLHVCVTKVYGESTASKIIEMVEHAQSRKAKSEQFITRFAAFYTPIVVITAALLAVVPPLIVGGWTEWLRRALVFLVISCPCALVISVPLAFFGGIGAASRHGVLVKGGNYLETLNSVDTVVFDKTGTLTRGSFSVTKITSENTFTSEDVLRYAAAAESLSNHPIARSITAYYGKKVTSEIDSYTETAGFGVSAICDGKRILAGSMALLESEGVKAPECADVGTKVYVAADGVYAGCIVISDKIKDGCAEAMSELKSLGIKRTVMLTGDSNSIAEAVASKLSIDEYRAELLPADKTLHLEKIMADAKGKTAFLGDGINDAPVLARADVGIAMGALGSEAAIEAADVVLMKDDISSLCDALSIARRTRRIVKQNVVLSLGIKGIFLILGALGIAGMWTAVFGDVGVALIAVFNAMRIMKYNNKKRRTDAADRRIL